MTGKWVISVTLMPTYVAIGIRLCRFACHFFLHYLVGVMLNLRCINVNVTIVITIYIYTPGTKYIGGI